jgi:SAM-dependent methyltransferase
MPTINENIKMWDDLHAWPEGGDEWSKPWGNAERQWQITIYPRIARFLVPGARVIEIGPGMGRWTQRLLRHAVSICAVDISKKAIEGLQEKVIGQLPLSEKWRLTAHLCSGTDLPAADGSVDFVFSFDSLVHADYDTVAAYLKECARVLKPETGVGFIHHSNKASPNHWRGNTTAEGVKAELEKVGLCCRTQELSTWVHEQDLGHTDCFTTFGKSYQLFNNVVISDVLEEARLAKRLWSLYDWQEDQASARNGR